MLAFAGSGCDSFVCNFARTFRARGLKTCFQLLNRGSLSIRRDFHRRLQVTVVFVICTVRLFRLEGNELHCRKPSKQLVKLPTLRLRHCVVRTQGRPPSLGCFLEFAFSSLRVVSQKGAIHELIHRTIPLLSDFMNALTKSSQDDDLRFSPGLFLPRLKSHKRDSIQVDRQKRIVDRSRQLSHVSWFVTQEFVEGAQEPDVIDSEMNASPLGHDSLLSSGWGCRDWRYVPAHTCRYIHHPRCSFKPPPQFRKTVRISNRDLPNLPALMQNAFGSPATGVKSMSSPC